MRKILFICLIALLGVLLFMTIASGFPVQGVSIYSLKDIQLSSEDLKNKVEEVTELTSIKYPQKNSELTRNIKALEEEKQTFLEKTEYSSAEEIAKANMQESYDANYLWVTLGNYATREGVIAKLDFTTSSSGTPGLYDINFTMNGTYIGITDFIYSIENDQTLNFRIQNFSLVPGSDTVILQATFIVSDLAISF